MNENTFKKILYAVRNEIAFNPSNPAHMAFAAMINNLNFQNKIDALLAEEKDAENKEQFDLMNNILFSMFHHADYPLSNERMRKVFDTALLMYSKTKDKEEVDAPSKEPVRFVPDKEMIDTLNISLASAEAAWDKTKKRVVEKRDANISSKHLPEQKNRIYIYKENGKCFKELTYSKFVELDLSEKHRIIENESQLIYKTPGVNTPVSDEMLWEVIKFAMEKFGVNNANELVFNGSLKKQADDLVALKSTLEISSKEEAKEQPKKEVGEYKRPAMKNTEAFGLTGPIPTGKNHGKSDPDELRMQAMSNNQPNRNRFGK